MDTAYSIEHVRHLAYRCKNQEVVRLLSWDHEKNPVADQWDYARVIKAHALFELHRVSELNQCLEDLEKDPHAALDFKLYSRARQDYFKKRYSEALLGFEQVFANTSTSHFKFRALLGVANVHYSEGRYTEIPSVIEKIHQYTENPRDDDRLS